MADIIVAVDGSKHSEKVVDVSCQLAKELSASIVLIYVMRRMPEEPEGIKSFEETEHYDDACAKYLSAVGREVITKLGSLIENQKIPCTPVAEFGNPTEMILDCAKARNATMIVVGMHAHHYVARIRSLGSVARNVIENATCPVLVVP